MGADRTDILSAAQDGSHLATREGLLRLDPGCGDTMKNHLRGCFCLIAALSCLVSPMSVTAQQATSLGEPDAEFAEPFTQIRNIRELRDGRVLVVDPRDRIVQLIDFRTGTATKVGRTGAGPGEFGLPDRIIALPGDSSAIFDPDNSRYLIIAPDGKTGATFRVDDAGVRMGGRGAAPRGTDTRGRIFIEGSAFVATAGGGIAPGDSAPVLRLDRATKRLDTLAYVQLARGNSRGSGGPNGVMMMTGLKAFPSRDDWTPLPDGGVGIARVHDYHIERYSASGTRTAGPPVTWTSIPVTDAEKEAWRAARRGLPAAGRGGAIPKNLPPPPQSEFPAVMPPFVAAAMVARANGEMWVLRSHKSTDAPIYDVFGPTGSMVRRVAMPAPTSRLVGFGVNSVYVVRRDADDLEHLQRYRLP